MFQGYSPAAFFTKFLGHAAKAIEIEDIEARMAALEAAAPRR